MTRLFGTDGVRGVANRDLTPELSLALGRAAVQVLGAAGPRPTVVVGRDTRASGEFLEAALCAGLCSAGADVVRAGVVPTPAVAFLTVDRAAQMGVVISASHNPPEYNGIKLFSADGAKLPDEVELEMERLVDAGGGPRPEGSALGRITGSPDAERYLEHLVSAAGGTLGGMRVVIDCANGAAYLLGPEILRRLGAEVYAINDEPDGANINVDCGATHPDAITEAARRFGADAGVSHDGDADRAILSDADGNIVDGDQILAAAAIAYKRGGRLTHNTVVSTVMANLGFRKTMAGEGIDVIETQVGDRYVLEEMLRRDAVVGGEQSGHIIFRDQATTGDGLLTAAWFLCEARRQGVSVAELASITKRYPQVLQNVPVSNHISLEDAGAVWEAVRIAEETMGDRGRVLVRASGTEPLVRVMVEAESEEDATRHANAISGAVRSSLT